jgi:hypothetical protein
MMHPLTPDDIEIVGHLLPPSAHVLIKHLGVAPALALLNTWPGVQFQMPRRPDANPAGAKKWKFIASIMGEEATGKLAAYAGGDVLEIPMCRAARDELRHRTIRAEFDALTLVEGISKSQAVQILGLKYGLVWRQMEKIIDRPDAAAPAAVQESLF